MSSSPAEAPDQIVLTLHPADLVSLKHAASKAMMDLNDFILHHALRAARNATMGEEHLLVSERDYQRVMDLLEHPPAPNTRMIQAARRLPKER